MCPCRDHSSLTRSSLSQGCRYPPGRRCSSMGFELRPSEALAKRSNAAGRTFCLGGGGVTEMGRSTCPLTRV